LASLHSNNDWTEASTFCKTKLSNQQCWIGMNDISVEGTYVNSDGTATDYFSWGTGEPSGNAIPTEDCVSLYPPKQYNMIDFPCS